MNIYTYDIVIMSSTLITFYHKSHHLIYRLCVKKRHFNHLFLVKRRHQFVWVVPILSYSPALVPPQSMVYQELHTYIQQANKQGTLTCIEPNYWIIIHLYESIHWFAHIQVKLAANVNNKTCSISTTLIVKEDLI